MRKLFLMGVGSVAMTMEKAKEILDDLVKRGELTVDQAKELADELVRKGEATVEQGKVFNEELKHNLKDKVNININVEKDTEDLLARVDKMTPEELAKLRAKLAELDQEEQEGCCE